MILLLLLCFTGCAKADASTVEQGSEQTVIETQAKEEHQGTFSAPEIEEPYFDKDSAEYKNGAYIDLSHSELGYVAVSASSDSRLKFQVLTDLTYTYDLAGDNTVSFFPLQSGDGEYSFRVMEKISPEENRYAVLFQTSKNVKLADEFQPFLRSSDYVSFNRDSKCVKVVSDLSSTCDSALEVVEKVYGYVCDHVTYDREKAQNVKSGYLPVLDETLESGKGICFDYAALTAGMLRSQGIPCKMIFGYVSPNDLYHAWNMFYTEESGWVTVEFSVNEKEWTRIDLTFSANGADQTFIGNGDNYADVYEY